jgi:hypothetical protein
MISLDLMSEIPLIPAQEDLNRLVRYLTAALSNPDPVRISVLLAQGLIEEMIDDFIKEGSVRPESAFSIPWSLEN